jgi:hypothetical protein
MEALIEHYEHESLGTPTSKTNGYTYGKWCKDISVISWREDIEKGDMCKAEFIHSIDGWWAKDALSTVIVRCPWFPFEGVTSSTFPTLLAEVKSIVGVSRDE